MSGSLKWWPSVSGERRDAITSKILLRRRTKGPQKPPPPSWSTRSLTRSSQSRSRRTTRKTRRTPASAGAVASAR